MPLRVGRYEVLTHLATGGMAQIYLARQTGLGAFERHVVLKTILRERATDQRFVTMFLDEAKLAATLNHQNIAQVYEVDQADGAYFMAMEYVHGENARAILETTLRRGWTIPLELAVMIVSGAAAGLHHAHERKGKQGQPLNIVHRDVSPANIIVAFDGVVKIVDFGIAKASVRSAQTHSGTLKGKIAYMSPEQCNGKPVDRRTDVFALGIVLYELLTVRRLFKADTDFLTMSSIVAGRIEKPSRFRADLPKPLENITLKALAHDPAMRFQTADEMRLALEQFANSAGLRTSTTALADYMDQEFGHRPEPWLVEDDDAPKIEVDFDGSGTGAASVPVMPTNGAYVLPSIESEGWGVGGDVPTTAGGTPVAWESRPSARRTRRRWWLLALSAASIVAALVATGVFSSDDSPASADSERAGVNPASSPTPPATAPGTEGAASAGSGALAHAAPTGSASTAPIGAIPSEPATGSATAAGSATTAGRPSKAAKPIAKHKAVRPRATWDEESLFPK